MAGAELVADFGVVLGALVDILDHQRDRRAGRHLAAGTVILEHAGQDLHLVRLAPLRGEAVLARFALVEERLDVSLAQRQAGRAAIHHAAKRTPMTFAERGNAEQVAERVV
jgi:hypothetical protein